MEGQSPVEIGRQADADAGETGVCRAARHKHQQQHEARYYQEKETEYLNDDDDEDTYSEDMTAGSGISSNHRAASVSPQDGSLNKKVSGGKGGKETSDKEGQN